MAFDGRGYYRGINYAGGEFGNRRGAVYGTTGDYYYGGTAGLAFLRARGHRMIRFPFLWERIQPTLGAALDATEVSRVRDFVDAADVAGLRVVLDIHNYGRYYTTNTTETVMGVGVTSAQFVDLWSRMSAAFKNTPAILGYGLMNEPHDLGGTPPADITLWETASQNAVSAIRANGDTTPVFVAPYARWSQTLAWETNHPQPWITDSADAIIYENHFYFDSDASGSYQLTYAQEVTTATQQGFASVTARALWRLNDFIGWVANHHVRGFIGEVGWPNGTDAASWNAVGEAVYAAMDDAGLGTSPWATGHAWETTFPLGCYYAPATYPRGQALSIVAAQASVLEAHPSTRAFVRRNVTATINGNSTPIALLP